MDVAHQLLEDVVERDDADGPPIFIHHQRQMGVFLEEEIEQFLERHHLRHRQEIAFDREKTGLGIAVQAEEVLDVDQAHGVIQVAFAQREAGMAR